MRIPTSPNTPATLVGRDRELGVLRDHLADMLAGQGSLVLIGGEAGIGKTALAEMLCREVAEQDAIVLTGRCFDIADTPAYGPWLYLFDRYHPSDALPARPATFAERGVIGEVSSQADLFRQVLMFMETLAARRPIVLVLDDLHWADPASLDLLRYLAQSAATMPLLIVVTYRSDELTRHTPLYQLLPSLVRESSADRLDLHRLDDGAVRVLVTGRYHLTDADTDRLVTYLQARAEGNALFIGELLRSLEEASILRREDASGMLGELVNMTVPPLLRQVIDGRLARLSEEAQRSLAIAAVIGQEVPFAAWESVAGNGEAALLDTVERATAAHLVEPTIDGAGIHFVHALIREALYEGVPPLRRRVVHRQVGEVLAALPNPDPDALAYHFHRAGDTRAVEWLIDAGDRAHRAWAWLTAAERYEMAVVLMEANGVGAGERGWLLFRLALRRRYGDTARALAHLEAAGRLAAEAHDALLAAQVVFYRGNIHCLAGQIGEGVAEMAESVAALASLPTVDKELWSGMTLADATSARATHFTWLGNVGRFAEACALGEEYAAEVAAGMPNWMGNSQYSFAVGGLQQVYAYQGKLEAAQRAFHHAYDFQRTRDNHLHLGVVMMYELLWEAVPYRADDVTERRRLAAEAESAWARGGGARTAVPARFARLPVLFLDGQWDEARTLALAGHFESGGYVMSKLFAFAILGPLAQAQGDAEVAERLVREWLPDGPATPPGDTFYAVTILQRVAAAMAIAANDLPTARQWLEAHDRWLAWSGAVLGLAEKHLGWAHYYRAAGDPIAAYQYATQAFAHASNPRQPLALIAAHRLLGELDTAAGRFEGAARHVAEALARADACQAPYERALTLLADAALRAATGEGAGALRLLDEVRAICTPLGAQIALAQAEALAAHLTPARAASPAYPAGLSAREIEVLRLVAGGLSNRDIAEHLFLSARTVQVHIAHIFAKTGAENRAAATAFAMRHHLA